MCEAAGGKFVGGWLRFGDYDIVVIAAMPDNESMAAVALAVGAGGAIKASKTTVLMTGDQGVTALKKASAVTRGYTPARLALITVDVAVLRSRRFRLRGRLTIGLDHNSP